MFNPTMIPGNYLSNYNNQADPNNNAETTDAAIYARANAMNTMSGAAGGGMGSSMAAPSNAAIIEQFLASKQREQALLSSQFPGVNANPAAAALMMQRAGMSANFPGMGMNMGMGMGMMGMGGLGGFPLGLLSGQGMGGGGHQHFLPVLGGGGFRGDPSLLPDHLGPLSNGGGDGSGRKGRTGTFPQKMHLMLADLEQEEGGREIASFLPHGRAFCIHKPKDFVKKVMPKYFRMSRFSSFQRQLNLYEFQRITEGPDKGAYYHELFLHGRPMLCTQIKRHKIKGQRPTTAATAPAATAGQQQQFLVGALLNATVPNNVMATKPTEGAKPEESSSPALGSVSSKSSS
jgi:hypothetical protein